MHVVIIWDMRGYAQIERQININRQTDKSTDPQLYPHTQRQMDKYYIDIHLTL